MSSTTPTYTASVSTDILRYMIKYATGNDGCIDFMTATFQPSGENVIGLNAYSSIQTTGKNTIGITVKKEAGFFFQLQNVPQGIGVQIVFFSLTIPQDTFLINLSFTTTQDNTYQLAQINTLPPNPNYALVVIVCLTVTVQPAPNVNITPLLQAFTSFASNNCTTAKPPCVQFSGNGFNIIYGYNYVYNNMFGALFIAQNTTTSTNTAKITLTINNNVVTTVEIATPPLEYAYFLFTLSLVFTSE